MAGAVTQYRSDIDGLRAVAVGGVVLFHAFPTLLPGGFIGVDVFFVLSGFLITSIIVSEAAAGEFSIAGFYERRFRRILPALAAVLLVTAAAALAILPPTELRSFGRSLAGVALFASNISFWLESGYFDAASADKPLLHTWSLAVEEQFYIVWPLIAAALIRLGRRRLLRWFVWAAVIVSLAAAAVAVRVAPAQAFYLLPYRAWELGFGALLAVGAIPAFRTAAQREVAAWAGLALIAGPMMLYTEATPFPGLAAAPPCLGTLLLIHAGQGYDTRLGRILSMRPILYTGLVSYSFYLWHWPLLVLPRIALDRALTPAEAALAVAAAFGLAALSLRFVEKPFRGRGTFRLSRARVMLASGASFALFGAAGAAAWASEGFIAQASPRVRQAERAMASVNPLRTACHADEGAAGPAAIARCTGGARDPGGGYQVLLWGDSHADHLMPGLSRLGRERGFTVRQATASGCSPVRLGLNRRDCGSYHRAVIAEAARQPKLRAIVLSARWSTMLEGVLRANGGGEAGLAAFRAGVATLLQETRAEIGPDARIVLLGSTPEFAFWPATCVARAARMDRDESRCLRAADTNARLSRMADRALASLAGPGVAVVQAREAFCDGDRCRTAIGDAILYRDDDHLTNEGSLLMARRLAPELTPSARPRLAAAFR